MKGKLKNKRGINVLFKIISVLIIFICIYLLRYDILIFYNSVFPPRKIEAIELSEQKKIEDFEFVYDTISSSMPMISEYDELYGIDFTGRKEYYRSLIKETNSDFEYYCTMQAILQDIPSFHTDLIYPSVDSIKNMHCYNSKKAAANRGVIQKNSYWSSVIDENVKSKENTKYCVFEYIDGSYIIDPLSSTIDMGEKLKIVSVNNLAVDEYAISRVFTSSLHYDGKNKKAHRTRSIFCDDNTGENVHLKLKDDKGNIMEHTLYFSLENEEIYYDSVEPTSIDQKNYSYYENDFVSYIKIDSMESKYGSEIKSVISNFKNENVILDLRENYGGYTQFAANYIYPALYGDNIKVQSVWYMPKSRENSKIISNLFNRFILSFKETNNSPYSAENEVMLRSKVNMEYEGKSKINKNVIILTSEQTGSSADKFVSDMKSNEKALIIGNNTGGEGLMNSFNMSVIPNSGLTYIYAWWGKKTRWQR